MGVKITTTRGQPAGVRSISTSEASQRLHAGDPIFAYLVGLIEGDGFFSVSKKGKYVLYELGIELSIKDVQLIYKIKDLLGIGIVGFRERIPSVGPPETPPLGSKMVYFRIRKKSHLINFIIPIFDKYPLLSDKQYDYLRFREGLLSGIILYEDLPKYGAKASPTNSLNTLESIIKVPYFSA
jgi:LAGLIDADG DNA endonuclease family protein